MSLRKTKKPSKLFVLDTNVLLYDPNSLFRFQEHDLFIPMTTLEELDNNKKGVTEVARNCRQASRLLDEIVRAEHGTIEAGFGLSTFNGGNALGRLFLQTEAFEGKLPVNLPSHKGDNEILRVCCALKDKWPGRQVVLVSKDINLRIKAAALKIEAEDYWNDNVVEDADLLYTGQEAFAEDFWNDCKILSSRKEGGRTVMELEGDVCHKLLPNMMVSAPGNGGSFVATVLEADGGRAKIREMTDYQSPKNEVWGIHAKNLEQSFALNLLLDPEIDIVSILGQAGSGKTLLTLAASLNLLWEKKTHQELIFTRITVPVGEDIGFLPGTEEEKMMPWMGALEDNLEALTGGNGHSGEWGKNATKDVLRSKIKVKSMTFMRGRTFLNKILVIDEAQNLTPKQMKTLVTRAGNGTKVICLGNIAQIDAPYLTESSCGLSYLVERMKGWPHYGHVTLAKVERSRLADHAASVL